MNLPLQIGQFKSLKHGVTGEVFLSGQPSGVYVELQPGGNVTFGPMPEPMPAYIHFKSRGFDSFSRASKDEDYKRLSEEFIDAGIHTLLLLDPRIYVKAEKSGLLTYTSGDDPSEVIVAYEINKVGVQILHMPEHIALGAAHDARGLFRTRIAIRDESYLYIRVNDSIVGVEDGFVRYDLKDVR